MAYIQERKNKNGEVISYSIRVHKGEDNTGKQLKPYTTTFKPDPNMTKKQVEKALNAFVVQFEQACLNGTIVDTKQTFSQYAEYVLSLKKRTGTKHRTLCRYKELLERINEGIGHIKLAELKPQHLNKLYEQLSQAGIRKDKGTASSKVDLKALISEKGLTKKAFAEFTGVSLVTLSVAFRQKNISLEKAQAISNGLNTNVNKLFNINIDTSPLSNKTIVEHHRLISTILTQAEKEMLIPYNVARKATPPKVERKQANYFQAEDVERIRDCLELVPLKWKTITHLLLISGARRGEIAGLKWNCIDWKNNQIHICCDLLYASDIGIYEDTTKTAESDRWVKLPIETISLLKEYRLWYMEQATLYGDKWHNTGYLFFQDKAGNEGKPMNPDSITGWLDNFSDKHKLPHINPHAFRHTMASLLYFNGIDSISISKRLGHAKVSTTTDIYSHIIKQADEQAAECIADIFLRKAK